MKILAIETSTEFCSVAIWHDGVIYEHFERAGQKHSEILMEMLDSLLRDTGVSLSQLDGIAFGAGPGSFTGVRIACSTTQGLAIGANLSVVGVCTLQAMAESTGQSRVIAALDARMGEIYHAVYEKVNGGWVILSAPSLCKAQDAPKVSGMGWIGVGSGFASIDSSLMEGYPGQVERVDSLMVPRASSVASLAAVQFLQGKGLDASLAQPFYLREKVAFKTFERELISRGK